MCSRPDAANGTHLGFAKRLKVLKHRLENALYRKVIDVYGFSL